VVSVLTPAEVLIAAWRLAGARPHLAAVAEIVHHEDLWQLCRDELTGASTSAPAAGISAAAGSASWSRPRRGAGELPRGQTISWRVIAAQLASRDRRGSR
jgi:hypothetical protein